MRRIHRIHGSKAFGGLRALEDFTNTQAEQVGEKVEALLDSTSYTDSRDPSRTHNWLELYAVTYRYAATGHVMTAGEREDLRDRLNEASRRYWNTSTSGAGPRRTTCHSPEQE